MNLTPEQRVTLLMLFAAYAVEQSIEQTSGVTAPWPVSLAVVILPRPRR